jgi:serine/threonine-protein kinase
VFPKTVPSVGAQPSPSGATVLGGHYVLQRVARRGRTRTWHQAWDTVRQRPVFVVVMDGWSDLPPDEQRRRTTSMDLLGAIRHPHVVQLLNRGLTAAGQPFFCLECFPGTPLVASLKTQTLSPAGAAGLTCQLLEGLEAVHFADVLHRRVGTANVLFQHGEVGPVVKLVGFDSAVRMSRGEETRWNPAEGTTRYMPPEQITGARLDARTDVYATGVILAELLIRKPFQASAITEQLSSVPGALVEVLTRALAQQPEDRYPSARAMRHALIDFAGDQAVALFPA